ncbi:DUF459 domain-containing protein [Agrobacterium sp. a22-2]|uniref:SGNH/GDSL hydrolase family protein n=1 Tax=Agrobacterium sp. a22-2 TaxID=2283840 RepID=UPI001FEDB242|nr:DUF459 domain-containing protein [Agrobacterium sp. a22-2]
MAVAVATAMLMSWMPPAVAQERVERRTLLQLLFGRPAPRQPEYRRAPIRPPVRVPRAAKKTSSSVTTITTTRAPEVPPPPPKLGSAQKILVVGDFLAGGIGEGLIEAFANAPGTTIEIRSNGSSGLVRDDYYNWPAELPVLLDEIKPALVVVELGANDRQQMTTTSAREKFPTDAWFAEYEKRVNAFAHLVVDRDIPLLWVGIPPFKSAGMTADVIKLNEVFRSTAEKVGGEFIDIWDGFVDQDGRFVLTGSDINGQQVRLRGSDGINLTAAGKRKIAFYLEKPARRHLGDMASPGLLRLDADNLPELISLPPSEMRNVVRTQPIGLTDPALDGSAELLGAGPLAASPIPSPRDQLVQTGILPLAPTGRVDDYQIGSKPQP